MIDYKETGQRMKARRLALDRSLRDVANEIGCTATTLKRWEDGQIASLKTTKIIQIAKALKTTPEELLGLVEKVTPRNDILPPPDTKIDADFTVIMPDDSMINARIFKGDEVYVKEQNDVQKGELAVLLLNDELMIRRIYKYKNSIELRPESPIWPVINLEKGAVLKFKIIGKPIAFLGELK